MLPRGLRNNNPLNIRHGRSRWQGAHQEQNDPDFVTFRSMAWGYRAAWKLLSTYRERLARQSKTYCLNHIIARWAPPEDGNDTRAYLHAVLRLAGGIGGRECLPPPDTPEGHDKLTPVVAAMTCVENGIRPEEVPRGAIEEGYHLAFGSD